MEYLSNGIIEVAISHKGAELQSLKKVKAEHEYMWQGDETYWNRQAPLLFPIVGNAWNKEIIVNGAAYPIDKHGFLRDMQFSTLRAERLEVTLRASRSNDTTVSFPWPFEVDVTYSIRRNVLTQKWIVRNTGNTTMHFQIGGHPGFNLPDYKSTDELHGYLSFNKTNQLTSAVIRPGGYVNGEDYKIDLTDGRLPLTNHTFDCDTILDCTGLLNRVTIHDKNNKPYLTTIFQTPVLALWSPCGGNAPFVCIEPWYGCCADENTPCEFADRRFMNHLEPGQEFVGGMEIIVE